jgi:hypothetical protein
MEQERRSDTGGFWEAPELAICPVCEEPRGPQQPEDSWALHLAVCASIADSE